MLWYIIWCLGVIYPSVSTYRSSGLGSAIGMALGAVICMTVAMLVAWSLATNYLFNHNYLIHRSDEDEQYKLLPIRENSKAYIIMITEDEEGEIPLAYQVLYKDEENNERRLTIKENENISIVPTDADKEPYIVMQYEGLKNSFLNWLLGATFINYTIYIPSEEEGE